MSGMDVKLVDTLGRELRGVLRPLNFAADFLDWHVNWFPKMWSLSGDALYGDSYWKVEDIWKAYQNHNGAAVYVIDIDGKILGWIAFCYTDYQGSKGDACSYVGFLSVSPDHRHGVRSVRVKGIGKLLLGCVGLKGMNASNSATIELSSLPDAEDFYTKLAFYKTGNVTSEGLNEFRIDPPPALSLIRDFIKSTK